MVQRYVRYGKIRELYVISSIVDGNLFLRRESIPKFVGNINANVPLVYIAS